MIFGGWLRSTWKQISYNFCFFLGGFYQKAVPRSLTKRALAIDEASHLSAFGPIVFLFCLQTTFFPVSHVYLRVAFFEPLVIDATTIGPRTKHGHFGFKSDFDDGSCWFRSWWLCGLHICCFEWELSVLDVIQFRFIERIGCSTHDRKSTWVNGY